MSLSALSLRLLCIHLTFFAYPLFGAASRSSAQSSESEIKLKYDLQLINEQIDKLLEKARLVREKRDELEDEADKLEDRDPKAFEQMELQADQLHEDLVKMLYELEDLLKKRDFILKELGHPENQQDSPYQP